LLTWRRHIKPWEYDLRLRLYCVRKSGESLTELQGVTVVRDAPGTGQEVKKMNEFAIFAALALVLGYGVALAEEPGDAARGLSYSKKSCAQCHGVEAKDPGSPNPDALTFKEYANRPGTTGTALAVWLQEPHPSMPELVVPFDDRDDLIAYILSLKDGAAGGKQ